MDTPKANSKAKILVVDDEPNVLLTLRAILQQEGYDVDAASGGAEAIGAIRQHHYDLVLTDLKMPRVDGLAVLQEVRKSSPHSVTIMMTGYGSLHSAIEAVQAGAYEYLVKPTEVEELKLAVARSLERKRLSEIDTLYRVQRTIANRLEPATIANEVADAARSVLNVADAWFLSFGIQASDSDFDLLLSDAALREALSAGTIVGANSDIAAVRSWAFERGIADFVFVPGLAQGKLVCVLCAHNGTAPYEFHASACRFLQALATQAALALHNAQLIAELRSNNRELEEANCKLRELDRLKSQFLSVATHELRTPLTVILGYNTILAESLGDRLTPDEQDTLQESVASCKRLIRLVNSMLDISQIESGKMQMNLAPADLRQVISSVERLFRHEAAARKIGLHVQMPARLPRLYADVERVQQVLINLVGNALKFTPAGGHIVLSINLSRDHRAIEVAVRDTGIGISAENQARIFDEFAQIQHSQSDPGHGAGLGLAIARRIVQAHNGKLEVSSAPGKGAIFTFKLPLKRHRVVIKRAISA